MREIYLMIMFIVCVIGAGIIGWMLGANHEMQTREWARREDNKLAQKLINEQYDRGYKDGFMAKVTPNEIRKVMGFPIVKENDFMERGNE